MFKGRLRGLAEQLIANYEGFTVKYCGELMKRVEDQPQQVSRYSEQLRLAKEEDERIRARARTRKEFLLL